MTGLVRALYRVRFPLLAVTALTRALSTLVRRLAPDGGHDDPLGRFAPVVLVAFALALVLFPIGRRFHVEPAEVEVASPVRGRWLALNSPATAVPSHGTRAYGQGFAVDLVAEPGGPDSPRRPEFASGPGMRAASDYPAFGQPVHAMVDGEVVRAAGRRRDHRARSRTWAVLYMVLEGMIREFGGPGAVVGNHVAVRAEDGTVALVAHLQQGSLRVRHGDRVRAGDVVGLCGNSGNSSEPHVHAQLMDRVSLWVAHGVPMRFTGITVDGGADTSDAAVPDGLLTDDTVPTATMPSATMPAAGEHLVSVEAHGL